MKLFYTLAAAIGIVSISLGIRYYHQALIPPFSDMEHPYIYLDLDPSKVITTLHPGQVFWLRTQTQRIAECNISIDYSLVQFTTNSEIIVRKVFYSFPPIISTSIIGKGMTDRQLQMPEFIPKGRYQFIRQAEYDCDGSLINQPTPPIDLMVE